MRGGSRKHAGGEHARHAPRIIGLAILGLALLFIAIGIATGT
jgi:hypothetical protein